MGFFDKIFGKKDSGRIETLESTLSFAPMHCLQRCGIPILIGAFPKKFKLLLKHLENRKTDLILWDGPYEILPSLTLPIASVVDQYDQFEYLFKDLNTSTKGFKKIPFARSKEGDRFKYLFFIQPEDAACEESIYFEDIDFPRGGMVKICHSIDELFEAVEPNEQTTHLSFRNQLFSALKDNFELPEKVSRFADRHEGIQVRPRPTDDTSETKIELHATFILDTEDKSEITNIHVDLKFVTEDSIIFSYSTYSVTKNGLKHQFENNFNYRIFYYKWLIFIEEIKYLTKQLAIQNIDISPDLDKQFDALTLGKELSKPFVQIDYMEV